MCGRARFAILANRQIRRYTSSSSSARNRTGNNRRAINGNERRGNTSSGPQAAEQIQSTEETQESSNHPDVPPLNDDTDPAKVIENVSPGFVVPTVRFDGENFVEEEMVWGLIPIFNMNEKPDHYRLFNKRIESFSNDNQYFNRLVQSKRCVVVFDGFYEWKMIAGKKQPYYIHLKDQPIQMAAIYEDFRHDFSNPYLEKVSKSFSIITGTPCQKFQDVHNRQPIFLSDDQALQWLNPEASGLALLEILEKNSSNQSFEVNKSISFHPVHQRMTDPKYQNADCSRPFSLGMNMGSFLVSRDEKKLLNQREEGQKDNNTNDDVNVLPKEIVGVKRKAEAIDLTDLSDEPPSSPPSKTLKSLPGTPTNKLMKGGKAKEAEKGKAGIMQYFKVQK